MKKYTAWLLAFLLALGLTGCSEKETPVYVQKVSDLAQMGGIGAADRFSGIVVSESVTEIKRDSDKTVDSLLVEQGDDVVENQPLFSYDTDELQLALDKQRLEQEQLESSIENYAAQIEQLEKDRERANSKDKLEYTLQIQTNQIDLKEAELKLKTKQSEIQKSEHLLNNAVVVSPVAGRVTEICEEGTDDRGNPKPYITIQKTGSYRVKGVLNEMQRGSIMEGDTVRMESRLNPEEFWTGTVSLVDYENPTQDSGSRYSSDSDEMGSSSRYPFYVEMDSFEGMLLGQHVYITIDAGEAPVLEGVLLSSSFLCYEEDGSTYVWADDGHGKLEKRVVELGEYDGATDRYKIASGLTEDDYVAFPEEELCKEGAPTTKTIVEGGVK